MTKRHTDGRDGEGDRTGGTERAGRGGSPSYPLQILRRRRQQRLAAAEPVASVDQVLAQPDLLQPLAHLIRAPLGKRQLRVSDRGGKNGEKMNDGSETGSLPAVGGGGLCYRVLAGRASLGPAVDLKPPLLKRPSSESWT